MLNNDYVTPPAVKAYASNYGVAPGRYFTDGSDRPPFYAAWQPRLGFSYDLTGQGRHILFGGYGRYYDRVFCNAGLDERFRLQFSVLTFRFSPAGLPDPNGNPTIVWKPEYSSKEGLDGLVASGQGPAPEAFLIENDTKPPVSDQFNVGVRTSRAGILLTANYAGIRAGNGFTFIFGNRNPDGSCCRQSPGFANLLLSSATKKTWYDALYLTADRPFDGKWGMNVAYTLSRADANGGDLFSLDYITPAAYGRHPTSSDERNRVVATAIVGIPGDVVLSSILTLSSGLGFTISDATDGFAFGQFKVRLYEGRPTHDLAFRSWDVRIEKQFRIGSRQRVSAALEAFNLTNYTNDADYEGFLPPRPETNPLFGQPRKVVDNSARRLQVALRYTF